MKTRRNAILAATSAVLVVLVGAGAAEAAWLSSGSGSGKAKADQLRAAAAGNGSTVTSSSITIAVTGGPTSGPTPTSYRVDRTSAAAPGAATGVCTITASSGTGSCTDTGLSAGTAYTYAVVSKLGTNWVSSSNLAVSGTTSGASKLHISSLTAVAAQQNTNKFHATVTVTVADQNGTAVSAVTVTGTWTPAGATTNGNCSTTTNASGVCTDTTGASDFNTGTSYTWNISSLAKSGFTYDSTADVKRSITVNCPATGSCTVS